MTVMTEKEKTTDAMVPSHKHELEGAEAMRPGRLFTPAVDILESETDITVLADMPGVRADGLTIDLRDNVLTIDGTVGELEGKDEETMLHEYDTGSFHREFRLSNVIDREKIDATLGDGVLRLTLPKAEAVRPRQIKVKVG